MTKTAKSKLPAENQQNSAWQFNAADEPQPVTTLTSAIQPVNWAAHEFVAHEKDLGWYMGLGLFAAVASTIVYFISSHDVVATVVVIVVAAAFGFSASRKPRELTYSIDSAGVHIGDKLYQYDEFKSFSLIEENESQSVWLMPLKRFMPIIPIYFHPEDEKIIVETLSNILPFENHEPGMVDKLMERVRF